MTPLRIGHVGPPPHPSFAATVAQDPLLERVEIPLDAPLEAQLEALASCDAYYCMAARDELPPPLHVHDALLARLPRLLMAASYGAGYDALDPAACTRAAVVLVNQAGGNARGVAEHAVAMMLACLKRIPESHARMRAGTARDRTDQMGRELSGRTVGLVGCGHIGTLVSAMLRAAFGCRILACDPALDAAALAARGAGKVVLEELLERSDVVSLHCPLAPDTRGMLGAAEFARMRPGAVFVTTARGSIHDEAALLAALDSGHLAGAGLDVWQLEPPPPDHPLLHHPKVVASQHIAGVTQESRSNITRIAALAFSDLAAGRLPPRIVNPDALPAFEARWRARLSR
ncbi:NAD(P)-dependent oxidoreductase [Roseococcus sp. DSY-14]|uniref:NAD(P)-dependent oxidoreductase n=1 Tax=Roseococcus sp. DSY-14 TaxID=3369650 RepID=UPI00387ACE8F